MMKSLDLFKKYLLSFVLLTSLVNACNYTKCTSLSNQECKIQPAIINLHVNEYSQELHFEVVILLMAYLIKYVFEMKQKI